MFYILVFKFSNISTDDLYHSYIVIIISEGNISQETAWYK